MGAAAEFAFPERTIPDHVPPELVTPGFPFIFGMTTDRHPFNDLAASVHAGPDIIYAPYAYPGGTPAWVPRRMETLRAIYLDTEHFSSTDFSPFSKLTGGNWINSPAELDPPAHGPFRQMVNPAFTPKAMAALEDKIREYAVDYIDAFTAKGACEFMGDFAFEFPIKVFMDLMACRRTASASFWNGKPTCCTTTISRRSRRRPPRWSPTSPARSKTAAPIRATT